ncbi:MAG TPA: ABC-2 transporter permease [Clostridia bacterium]|nr:ABC-2 transporter permease [Clostridia bacterium]
MKGLMLKDYYTLLKQLKLYLVFIVILSVIPNTNLSSIAIVYAAMLPITVIAYDERSKWDQLAAMMPYSKRELVFSKFLIGYVGVAVCMLLSLGLQAIVGALGGQPFTTETVLAIILTSFAGLILLALNLPFMFWLGVERGRVVFMVLIAVTVFLGMMSAESAKKVLELSTITPEMLIGIGALAAVAVNVVAITVSFKLYQKKMV